jgi:hypothetical protein
MRHFSLCRNNDCPVAKSCVRFMAVRGKWETFLNPKPKDKQCVFYWDISNPGNVLLRKEP